MTVVGTPAAPAGGSGRFFLPLPSDRVAQRVARCLLGLTLFGFGISCFLTAGLGLAPWDIFHQGLANKTGIAIGLIIEITGVFILLLWIPLRERMGLGTLLNAVHIGLVVFLIDDHLPTTDVVALRVGYMLLGLVAVGIGSGLYIGAGLGTGPRDGLMLGLSKRGVSVRIARTVIELTVLAAGLVLGGTIGIGTLAFTFGIGPLVQFFLPRLRLPGDQTVLANAH